MHKNIFAIIFVICLIYFAICFTLIESIPIPSNYTMKFDVFSEPVPPIEPPKIVEPEEILEIELQNYTYAYILTHKPQTYEESCKIPEIVFSESEIIEYWNYRPYGNCTTVDKAMISMQNNTIFAECQGVATPLIHTDDNGPQKLAGSLPRVNWTETNAKSFHTGEFAIIKCYSTTYSYVYNRFQQNISSSCQEKSKRISPNSKPLAVLLLVVDSVSRSSSYQNWPQTMNYLHSLSEHFSEKYSFYDFKYAATSGANTRVNLIPILYGQTMKYHEEFLKGTRLPNYQESPKHLELQESAIWTYFSSLGYVTYFNFDTLYDYLSLSTGRDILADHVFANFWKIGKRVYGYNDYKENQRCLGDKNAHYFSFNYTYQFLENYRMNHRFGYVHISAAHEDSGNVKTVDADLLEFLQNTLKRFNNTNEDLVLLLISDHGRSANKLTFKPEGYYDHKLPMNYIVMNKELEEVTGSRKHLLHNSDKLMGKFDINLSLKTIAMAPYGGISYMEYRKRKSQYPVADVVSLFHEDIKENRSCEDIGISKKICICRAYEEVDVSRPLERIIIDEIRKISEEFISGSRESRSICEEAQVDSVAAAWKFEFRDKDDGWDTSYKIEFLVQYNVSVSVAASFCTKQRAIDAKLVYQKTKLPFNIFSIGGVEFYMKLEHIEVENSCSENVCICNNQQNFS